MLSRRWYVFVACLGYTGPWGRHWGQDRQDLCSHGAYRLVELVQLTNGLGRSSSFCNSVDCSLSGSSVQRIFQARILEWLPFPSPGDLSYPGIEPASLVFLALAGRFFTTSAAWEALHLSYSAQNKIEWYIGNYLESWPKKRASLLSLHTLQPDTCKFCLSLASSSAFNQSPKGSLFCL